jgi:hypothetical protein
MAKQIIPDLAAGLPGRPVMDVGDGVQIIKPGRILRDRSGKPMFFTDYADINFTIEAAGEFLKRDIRRVFFFSKKGERQQPVTLAAGPDAGDQMLSGAECLVIEMLRWLRNRERKKRKRLMVSTGN